MHAIQAGILKVLIFKTEAKFSELNPEKVSSDHFNFHVKKLLELGLIEKNRNDRYQLTKEGKEFANRFDVDSQKMAIERQAKIGVLIIPVKKKMERKNTLSSKD